MSDVFRAGRRQQPEEAFEVALEAVLDGIGHRFGPG
jgi:hypothetical protein